MITIKITEEEYKIIQDGLTELKWQLNSESRKQLLKDLESDLTLNNNKINAINNLKKKLLKEQE